MLRRKIDAFLQSWKERKHKPLLIQGARQVGKTTSIQQFGRQYDTFYDLNFIKNPLLTAIFDGDLDADTLKTNITLATGIEPNGKVLLLLDEIQRSRHALESLKFWNEQNEWDVIATGSELGVAFQRDRHEYSWPVGAIEHYKMNGLDFEEFCWAVNTPQNSIDTLRQCLKERKQVPPFIHQHFQDLMRNYMVIGGMPEVVQTFVLTRDYQKADDLQKQILDDYVKDIAHYAPPDIQVKAQSCYLSLPGQLSKKNHKFQYKMVEKNGTARKFSTALDWLQASRLIIPIYNVSTVGYPLESFEDISDFRVYPTEIGLLMAQHQTDLKAALLQDKKIETEPENPILSTSKGGLYEALAADMLWKAGYESPHFYNIPNRSMEIEFIVSGPAGCIPIEIKAGREKSKSLDDLLKEKNIDHGYKFGSYNAGQAGKKITLPLYMLPFLKEAESATFLEPVFI